VRYERPGGRGVAGIQSGQQRLSLATKMIEIGSSRKLVGHGPSVQAWDPQSGCTKDVRQRPKGTMKVS
jgi:hypothetical protein